MIRPHLIAFAAIVVFGSVALAMLPWWSLCAVAFVVGALVRPARAGTMLWPGLLAGMTSFALGIAVFDVGGGTLPGQIAELFGVGSTVALANIVCIVGGVSAGLPTLLGAYGRAVIQGRPVI